MANDSGKLHPIQIEVSDAVRQRLMMVRGLIPVFRPDLTVVGWSEVIEFVVMSLPIEALYQSAHEQVSAASAGTSPARDGRQ